MNISRGRREPCKTLLSGVKNVYLWKWVQYSLLEIKGVRGSSLTSYPSTVVYKFETVSDGNIYEESLTDDNAYQQSLSVTLKRVDSETNLQLSNLQNIVLGVVVEDYNGSFRLMGAFNGVSLDELNVTLGGGNSDFNGYKLELSGLERFKAPLFNNLNVGFIVDSGSNYLIDEFLNILTDENNNRLIYA